MPAWGQLLHCKTFKLSANNENLKNKNKTGLECRGKKTLVLGLNLFKQFKHTKAVSKYSFNIYNNNSYHLSAYSASSTVPGIIYTLKDSFLQRKVRKDISPRQTASKLQNQDLNSEQIVLKSNSSQNPKLIYCLSVVTQF